MGIFATPVQWHLVSAPLQACRRMSFSWSSMPIWRSASFPPHLGGWWLKGVAGSFYWELSLTFPIDHRGFRSSLGSSTTCCHFSWPPSFALHGHRRLTLACSPGLSRHLPACLFVLPFFSRWSLVWFRCPDAFTQWCFGCSRGKQASVLCFYYFPD